MNILSLSIVNGIYGDGDGDVAVIIEFVIGGMRVGQYTFMNK